MKLNSSKKAIAVDDLFPLLFAIIAFVFIILLFTYSHSRETSAINNNAAKLRISLSSSNVLQEFLAKEITFDINEGYSNLPSEQITMPLSEFIAYYYLEEDSKNKKSHYARISLNMQDFFNPLEYCYKTPEGIKVKKGYLIFITEDSTESYYGDWLATDRKFTSDSFDQDLVENKIIYPIPLPNLKILYFIFMESAVNAMSETSCRITR